VTARVEADFVNLTLRLTEKHIWDINEPNLYDLALTLNADSVTDQVESYFGLRSVCLRDNANYLNGRPLFQRLVLDQGFYPDGIYTAPNDGALIKDIEICMALGFNGARLHEKAFEERFLYHADRLGYLVWGEYANWGYDHSTTANISHYLPEWLALMERDFNHPALIGWCPFNETWDRNGHRQDDDLLSVVYQATKALDPTRPVIDTSGNYHVVTDIYDIHDYLQDVEEFHKRYGTLKKGEGYERMPDRQQYGGQPFFVSEYGGARWVPEQEVGEGWGYGDAPKTEQEFAERYAGLTGALINAEGVCAFCYTQLYDVEQEKNGLYTYDRQKKFPDWVYERIREVNTQVAAIEK
jgi:beta-galactosidase/beta-glucuronidase